VPQPESTMAELYKFSPPLQVQRSGEVAQAGNGPTGFSVGIPRRLTQEDQDIVDEEKQRESMEALVQTWLDSLQLISVITTFFVATEASWLVITIPDPTASDDGLSTIGQLANIGILSALIVHAHAAIISFLAAFCLIRYKLTVAEKEEEEIEEKLGEEKSPIGTSLNDPEKARNSLYKDDLRTVRRPVRVNSPLSGDKAIWSTHPRLEQVGLFQGSLPTQLLARCHFLCVFLSFVGFLLAFVGAISFTWDKLPRSIGISTTIATILCLVSAILIIVYPSTERSHIFKDSKPR